MDPGQFRLEIVRPTLQLMGLYSDAAENLLMGTALHESGGLKYVKQINGPALGFYQMEPATLWDLYRNWLKYRPIWRGILDSFKPRNMGRETALVMCLGYSTAAARLQYYRVPKPLPDADDIDSLAKYYKRHWNTSKGKASEYDFIRAYTKGA